MMKNITGYLSVLVSFLLTVAAGNAVAAAQPSESERDAIFKAAGFTAKGGQYIRCEEDPPTMSYMAGSIELADLNSDGKSEAWVKESSLFCYGHTAEFFVLLTQNENGAWVRLLESVGVPMVQAGQRNGWPEIEVGGPGSGPFPVYYFDGKQYVQGR